MLGGPGVYAGRQSLHPPMRGGAAPLQEQVVRLGSSILPKWGLRPHDPHGEGAPPLHPG